MVQYPSSLKDPRLHLSQESAADIDKIFADLGYSRADCVISGIPFKSLPHGLRDLIVRKTHAVLRPQGKFLIYQVSGTALPYLESVFGHVSRDFQFLNIIPARLLFCARALSSRLFRTCLTARPCLPSLPGVSVVSSTMTN